jgi:hypothetical protein
LKQTFHQFIVLVPLLGGCLSGGHPYGDDISHLSNDKNSIAMTFPGWVSEHQKSLAFEMLANEKSKSLCPGTAGHVLEEVESKRFRLSIFDVERSTPSHMIGKIRCLPGDSALADGGWTPKQEKHNRQEQRKGQHFNLQVTNTQPAADGSITITVQSNADTASLLVNGEEQGGRPSGNYVIKKVARAGQVTKFTIIATDINGNKGTKVITVTRQVVDSAVKFAELNPAQVKKQPQRDAVAVLIGISKYESLPIAEFANNDARTFYDYALRGLGVKPENIKLLVDEGAREAEILKAFKTWLPSRVKSTTDVIIFYSGHGLPTPDGNGLYLLPWQADREVIDDTAIPFTKINDAISLAKPKSVTVILDACYSGQTKAGQTLVASARPVSLTSQKSFFPHYFTVISASQSDQISSSSPDLQHGIFSYYLMKGMEGDADMNKDGKITLGEMRDYLVEQVGRQAAMMSRKQEPQLIGDASRVFVTR